MKFCWSPSSGPRAQERRWYTPGDSTFWGSRAASRESPRRDRRRLPAVAGSRIRVLQPPSPGGMAYATRVVNEQERGGVSSRDARRGRAETWGGAHATRVVDEQGADEQRQTRIHRDRTIFKGRDPGGGVKRQYEGVAYATRVVDEQGVDEHWHGELQRFP
jgi:hypothetical protein